MTKKPTMLKSSCPVDADSTNPSALFQSTNAKHFKCYQIRAINVQFVNILTMAHQTLQRIIFFIKATRTHAWQSPSCIDSRIVVPTNVHAMAAVPFRQRPRHIKASHCQQHLHPRTTTPQIVNVINTWWLPWPSFSRNSKIDQVPVYLRPKLPLESPIRRGRDRHREIGQH